MPTLVTLTPDDRNVLREMLADFRRRSRSSNRPSTTLDPLTMTPEVYVTLTPVGGIPARVSTVAGSAESDVYRIVDPDTLERVNGLSRTVYNLSTTAIGEDLFVPVSRDKFGSWLALGTGGGVAEAECCGLSYLFNDNNSQNDPGAGSIGLDDASPDLAETIYISFIDNNSNGVGDYIATWDDSDSLVKGRIEIRKVDDPTKFAIYHLTSIETAPSLTTMVLDTFTGTDSTALSAHSKDVGGSWQNGDNFEIQSNQASWLGGTGTGEFAVTNSGISDVLITCDITGSLGQGIVLRWTDDSNCWMCRYAAGTGLIEIIERAGGVDTVVASQSAGDPGAHTLIVEANGSVIEVSIEAATLTYSSATSNQTATKHGLYCGTADNTDRWDNFKVEGLAVLVSWTILHVTYVDGAGTFADGDELCVTFYRTGDAGANANFVGIIARVTIQPLGDETVVSSFVFNQYKLLEFDAVFLDTGGVVLNPTGGTGTGSGTGSGDGGDEFLFIEDGVYEIQCSIVLSPNVGLAYQAIGGFSFGGGRTYSDFSLAYVSGVMSNAVDPSVAAYNFTFERTFTNRFLAGDTLNVMATIQYRDLTNSGGFTIYAGGQISIRRIANLP